MGNASPLWHVDISSCWALAVQSWVAIKLQGHTSSRNILLLLVVPFVHMLTVGLTSISFGKRSSPGQWLQPQYYVEVVSWLLKMVGFSSTSSTSPSIVCCVVDLVTRLTSEASKACISFLNVWYLFSGRLSLFYLRRGNDFTLLFNVSLRWTCALLGPATITLFLLLSKLPCMVILIKVDIMLILDYLSLVTSISKVWFQMNAKLYATDRLNLNFHSD
jgi:hypothetical protein